LSGDGLGSGCGTGVSFGRRFLLLGFEIACAEQELKDEYGKGDDS
jgi:hypothetical protein